MRIGKREQMVGIGIGGLATIGVLHFFLFSPRAAALRQAYSESTTLEAQARDLKKIANLPKFNEFKKMTEELKTEYTDVFTSIGLSEAGVFAVKGNAENIVLDPPPPKTAKPDEIRNLKQRKLIDNFVDTVDIQIDEIQKQIRALRKYDKRLGGDASGKTEFLFLGDPKGWNLVPKLPSEIFTEGTSDTGRLVDALSNIAQTQGMIKVISSEEQPELYKRQREGYEQGVLTLGVDNAVYRDTSPTSLAAMGEYVPLIHKMAFAMLVEEAMANDPDHEIAGTKMSRKQLYEWLEIKPPVRPLQGGLIGELYYVNQELVLLNSLMDLMVEKEITQVFGVRFGPVSYVVAQPEMAKGDLQAKPEKEAPAIQASPYVLANVETVKRSASNPGPNDTGICIPVTIQFKAGNPNSMKFIYEFLENNQLDELDEIDIRGTPEGTDVFCQVKFIHVLRLLNISRQIGTATAKPAPGARPAPPPAAAPAATPAPAPAAE